MRWKLSLKHDDCTGDGFSLRGGFSSQAWRIMLRSVILRSGFSLVLCAIVGCAARPPVQVASIRLAAVSVDPRTDDVPGKFDQAAPLPGHGLGDISSHIFGIEARIVQIDAEGSLLKSITFNVIKPLPTALGSQPFETPGDQVVIRFDTDLGAIQPLGLTPNTVTDLYFGQLDGPDGQGGQDEQWASNLSWLCFWKDGQCYRIDVPRG